MTKPEYSYDESRKRRRFHFAVEDMKNHMTDEGWQLSRGLNTVNYELVGYRCGIPITDAREFLNAYDPGVVVIQDKREWIGKTAGGNLNPAYTFTNMDALKRPDIFRITVVKDAHSDRTLHCEAAEEMGIHAWLVYYDPEVVVKQAPYLREEHLIRIYHTVDTHTLPPMKPGYFDNRGVAVLSGAMNKRVYPLRVSMRLNRRLFPGMEVLQHPGYHKSGPTTPTYLQELSKYKVAICTASIYKYALRKIIEATACGCIVLTDLPASDRLPHIDENLARLKPGMSLHAINDLIQMLAENYDPVMQQVFAEKARSYYNHVTSALVLHKNIERMRKLYNDATPGNNSPWRDQYTK